jgi:uncharacterized membrane protein
MIERALTTKLGPPREKAPPSPAGLSVNDAALNQRQSGRPAASGGFVELEVEAVPVVLVLRPLVLLVLLPVLVPVISLRTCLVTLSQHFTEPGEAALGEVVVVEVWATAIPMLPASAAAAINPILVIRMWLILLIADEPRRALAVT